MLGRLLLRPAWLFHADVGYSRGMATEVLHPSTNTSVVDDAPGPAKQSQRPFRSEGRDLIPHDPRRAVRSGKIGFGSATPSTPTSSAPGKRSPAVPLNGKPRTPTVLINGKARVPRTANPFVLADRLVEIYNKQGPDKAVAELAVSKREARTVAVHNILMKKLLQDGRTESAYRVWMNMKRMGLVPTPMSYTIFFSTSPSSSSGHARESTEKMATVWKQWLSYCEKAADPETTLYELAQTPEYKVTTIPTNAYLANLQNAGPQSIQKMSELLDKLLETTGFVPTMHTFSVLFRSITIYLQQGTPTDKAKRASECYALCQKGWQIMYERWVGQGLQLDALALSAAAIAYRQIYTSAPSLFTQEDKRKLLEHFEALLGLPDPEEFNKQPEPSVGKIPRNMDSTVIYDAMVLASTFEGKYSRHILDWFSRLKQYDPKLLDARCCEMYMKAAPKSALETLVYMLRSPSARLRPTLSTYTAAMALSPFINQVKILAHMTGRSDILDPSETPLLQSGISLLNEEQNLSKRALEKGYHTKNLQPDAKVLVILLQSALDLKDWRRIDRALRIIQLFDANGPHGAETHSGRSGRSAAYALRLEDTITQACNKLLENPSVPNSRKTELEKLSQRQKRELKPRLTTQISDRSERYHK